jgi:hypothetical protein
MGRGTRRNEMIDGTAVETVTNVFTRRPILYFGSKNVQGGSLIERGRREVRRNVRVALFVTKE